MLGIMSTNCNRNLILFQAVLASPLNGQFFVIGNPTEILGKTKLQYFNLNSPGTIAVAFPELMIIEYGKGSANRRY